VGLDALLGKRISNESEISQKWDSGQARVLGICPVIRVVSMGRRNARSKSIWRGLSGQESFARPIQPEHYPG
jgi:hypothetical protein